MLKSFTNGSGRGALVAFAMAAVSWAAPARADEGGAPTTPTASDVGADRQGGDHSDGGGSSKTVVVASLAVVSVASLGVASYFWLDSYAKGRDAADLRDARPKGFCRAGESEASCLSVQDDYLAIQKDQDAAADRAYIFYTVGVLTGTAAMLTSHFWKTDDRTAAKGGPPPVSFTIAAQPGRAYLGARHAF